MNNELFDQQFENTNQNVIYKDSFLKTNNETHKLLVHKMNDYLNKFKRTAIVFKNNKKDDIYSMNCNKIEHIKDDNEFVKFIELNLQSKNIVIDINEILKKIDININKINLSEESTEIIKEYCLEYQIEDVHHLNEAMLKLLENNDFQFYIDGERYNRYTRIMYNNYKILCFTYSGNYIAFILYNNYCIIIENNDFYKIFHI